MKFFPILLTFFVNLVVTVHSGALDDTGSSSTRSQAGQCILKKEDDAVIVQSNSNKTRAYFEEDDDAFISEASYSEVSAPAPKDSDEFGSDMGVVQTIDSTRAKECLDRIEEAREYMTNRVLVEDTFEKTRDFCQNKHKDCTFWSVLGECENNPAYMLVNCAPVCQSCEMLHIETRCPMDPDAVDALKPGDVSRLFKKIAYSPEYQQYEPVVVSKPPQGPWMLMFENILSDTEAERLIELGGEQGYERSSDVGKEKEDGTHEKNVNSGRTSTNAWCIGDCMEDPVAQAVVTRIENITGIPESNSENLQLLRYQKDQYYQVHSDYIPYHTERRCGVRILTFYMYLNDVEEGGGTNFPNVNNLTVSPKRGRAVLWPSVLDEDPNTKDYRTNHQALPVTEGVKYGANAWIHQRDFKTANAKGCN